MFERMLNKQITPDIENMTAYCGKNAALFCYLNEWLSQEYATAQQTTFPYGNKYGWNITHRKKQKLICHVFPENGAFTVMVRLTNAQFASIYAHLQEYAQKYIDHKYPCGDGGWIHYRVTCKEHLNDIQTILSVKACGK